MKKALLSLVAVIAFSMATIAQWNTINSNLGGGIGVGQISVGLTNPNAMWAYGVDNTGLILDTYTKTVDGGSTWTKGNFNAGSGLSQLFAIDENTCWAVFNTGASQGLYKTINGGTTWAKQGTAFGSSSFADLLGFFDINHGFAVGDPVGNVFEIYTTTDGGITWTPVPSSNIPAPLSGEFGITGNYCTFGLNNAWFGTNKGRIFHSLDKGLHWSVTVTPFGTSQTVAPEFVDSIHGIAYRSFLDVGMGDSLNITNDGGITWAGIAVNGSMYARYITHIPGTSTYVGSAGLAGSAQGISFSYDGALTWWEISNGGDYLASAWKDIATGWCGSTAAKKSTGGMLVYTGDSLKPPVSAFFTPDTLVALGGDVVFTNQSTGNPTSFLWTFSGGNPASSTLETPPPVVYPTPGLKNVSLKVTSAFGVNTLLKTGYILVGGVGINEHSGNEISVYPIPAKDYFVAEATCVIKEIRLYNSSGQLVIANTCNTRSTTINTADLPSGVYSMKATLTTGSISKTIVIR